MERFFSRECVVCLVVGLVGVAVECEWSIVGEPLHDRIAVV